jgi:hypothetical protein
MYRGEMKLEKIYSSGKKAIYPLSERYHYEINIHEYVP